MNINTGVVNGTISFGARRHISKYSTGRIVRLFVVDDQPFNLVSKVQGGGGCVSVWGCITGGARDPLVMYSGKLNRGACVKVIEEALPSFVENTFDSSNQNWMFMHDNAPSRRSKCTLKWFENKGIKINKWFVVSLDLNPIENLWDLIDKKFKEMKPINVKELKQIIQPIWNGVTCLQCKVLVGSMPRRIDRCIKSAGGIFSKY